MNWFNIGNQLFFVYQNEFYFKIKVINENTSIIEFNENEKFEKLINVPNNFKFMKIGSNEYDKVFMDRFFISHQDSFQLFYDKIPILMINKDEIKILDNITIL